MISHKHKCIYIHIPKCAGSSVEKAFGIHNPKNNPDYDSLTGWCHKNKFLMQHATPQQLIDYGLISRQQWNSYYKFIIYRNSWDKALSDYLYFYKTSNILGKFESYLNGEEVYYNKLNKINYDNHTYEGSHLFKQVDYFVLNNEYIKYDLRIDFENIDEGFKKAIIDLKLDSNFFNEHVNESQHKIRHYSLLFNRGRANMIREMYSEDIEFFKFKFVDKRNFYDKVISNLDLRFLIKYIKKLKLTKTK